MIFKSNRSVGVFSRTDNIATSINRFLTNAHYEILRQSKHRLDFTVQTALSTRSSELHENIQSARFAENCKKCLNSLSKRYKQTRFFEVFFFFFYFYFRSKL